MICVGLLLAAGAPLLGARTVGAEEAEPDLDGRLRRAVRDDVTLADRQALVREVLAQSSALPVVPAVRAGISLLGDDPELGGTLILRALADGALPAEEEAAILRRFATVRDAAGDPPSPEARAVHAAVGMLLRDRAPDAAARITAAWPPSPMVLATILREVGGVPLADGTPLQATTEAAAVRALLESQRPFLELLDAAEKDDAVVSRKGLDGLLAAGKAAVPLLIHEVQQGTPEVMPGRRARATRAILVLGFLRDRRATGPLIEAMQGADGWMRTYAATALGDLGDPFAVVALARQCTLLGDPLRQRDQWEYPGKDNSTVSEADWPSAPYFVIDTSAADALLRLGVRGAAGWLITNQLDPRKKNHRIRVYQDATDALARSVRGIPIHLYNVDQGLPLRDRAWHQLLGWWHANRKAKGILRRELDENDPRYRSAAAGLALVYAGPSVRERMMAKAAIRLLGPLMTDALVTSIPTAKNAVHRAEIAESLGQVDDPRAVKGLLVLARDRQAFVRKKALKSLGSYVAGSPDAQAALLAFLKSKRGGSRLAALEGLVGANPSDTVRKALAAWIADDAKRVESGRATWITADVRTVLNVVQLVQEGDAHLDAVLAGLTSKHRAQRRITWDLVRLALDFPEPIHDPSAEPDVAWARRIGAAEIREALARRRGS